MNISIYNTLIKISKDYIETLNVFYKNNNDKNKRIKINIWELSIKLVVEIVVIVFTGLVRSMNLQCLELYLVIYCRER